ncbi:hypothetical protein LTR53_006446, partial [Teratosphaeriaceae sp. CCFEE 6253]
HAVDWEGAAVGQLFGWVHPWAVARACLAAIEQADDYEGAQVFNIAAPNTAQETPSLELARKYFPDAEIRGDWGEGNGNVSVWTTDKAERVLGWKDHELE